MQPMVMPRHVTSRHATPRHVTSRHATPRHVTSYHIGTIVVNRNSSIQCSQWSCHATSRHGTSRHVTSRHATPRHATLRHATSRHATSRHIISHKRMHCLTFQCALSNTRLHYKLCRNSTQRNRQLNSIQAYTVYTSAFVSRKPAI